MVAQEVGQGAQNAVGRVIGDLKDQTLDKCRIGNEFLAYKSVFSSDAHNCDWDRTQWNDPRCARALLANVREGMKSGVWGEVWDNLALIGAWDFDPSTVRCPVLLWYGREDRMVTPEHAYWFDQNLPDARLVMWETEGHLLAYAHLTEIMHALLA